MLVDIIFTLHWLLLSFRRSNITLGIAASILVQGYSNNDIFVLLPQAIFWEDPCFPHHKKDSSEFIVLIVVGMIFLSISSQWSISVFFPCSSELWFPYSISVAAWHFLLGILGHSVGSLRSTVCTPRRPWVYAKD